MPGQAPIILRFKLPIIISSMFPLLEDVFIIFVSLHVSFYYNLGFSLVMRVLKWGLHLWQDQQWLTRSTQDRFFFFSAMFTESSYLKILRYHQQSLLPICSSWYHRRQGSFIGNPCISLIVFLCCINQLIKKSGRWKLMVFYLWYMTSPVHFWVLYCL